MPKRTRSAARTAPQPMLQPRRNVLRRDLGRFRVIRGKLSALPSSIERARRSAVELAHRGLETVSQRSLDGIGSAFDPAEGCIAL